VFPEGYNVWRNLPRWCAFVSKIKCPADPSAGHLSGIREHHRLSGLPDRRLTDLLDSFISAY